MGSVSKPPFLSSSQIYGRLCKLCKQSCLSAQPALSSKPFQNHKPLATNIFAQTPSESSLIIVQAFARTPSEPHPKPLNNSPVYGRLCKLCKQSCLSVSATATSKTFLNSQNTNNQHLCTHSVRATPQSTLNQAFAQTLSESSLKTLYISSINGRLCKLCKQICYFTMPIFYTFST